MRTEANMLKKQRCEIENTSFLEDSGELFVLQANTACHWTSCYTEKNTTNACFVLIE